MQKLVTSTEQPWAGLEELLHTGSKVLNERPIPHLRVMLGSSTTPNERMRCFWGFFLGHTDFLLALTARLFYPTKPGSYQLPRENVYLELIASIKNAKTETWKQAHHEAFVKICHNVWHFLMFGHPQQEESSESSAAASAAVEPEEETAKLELILIYQALADKQIDEPLRRQTWKRLVGLMGLTGDDSFEPYDYVAQNPLKLNVAAVDAAIYALEKRLENFPAVRNDLLRLYYLKYQYLKSIEPRDDDELSETLHVIREHCLKSSPGELPRDIEKTVLNKDADLRCIWALASWVKAGELLAEINFDTCHKPEHGKIARWQLQLIGATEPGQQKMAVQYIVEGFPVGAVDEFKLNMLFHLLKNAKQTVFREANLDKCGYDELVSHFLNMLFKFDDPVVRDRLSKAPEIEVWVKSKQAGFVEVADETKLLVCRYVFERTVIAQLTNTTAPTVFEAFTGGAANLIALCEKGYQPAIEFLSEIAELFLMADEPRCFGNYAIAAYRYYREQKDPNRTVLIAGKLQNLAKLGHWETKLCLVDDAIAEGRPFSEPLSSWLDDILTQIITSITEPASSKIISPWDMYERFAKPVLKKALANEAQRKQCRQLILEFIHGDCLAPGAVLRLIQDGLEFFPRDEDLYYVLFMFCRAGASSAGAGDESKALEYAKRVSEQAIRPAAEGHGVAAAAAATATDLSDDKGARLEAMAGAIKKAILSPFTHGEDVDKFSFLGHFPLEIINKAVCSLIEENNFSTSEALYEFLKRKYLSKGLANGFHSIWYLNIPDGPPPYIEPQAKRRLCDLETALEKYRIFQGFRLFLLWVINDSEIKDLSYQCGVVQTILQSDKMDFEELASLANFLERLQLKKNSPVWKMLHEKIEPEVIRAFEPTKGGGPNIFFTKEGRAVGARLAQQLMQQNGALSRETCQLIAVSKASFPVYQMDTNKFLDHLRILKKEKVLFGSTSWWGKQAPFCEDVKFYLTNIPPGTLTGKNLNDCVKKLETGRYITNSVFVSGIYGEEKLKIMKCLSVHALHAQDDAMTATHILSFIGKHTEHQTQQRVALLAACDSKKWWLKTETQVSPELEDVAVAILVTACRTDLSETNQGQYAVAFGLLRRDRAINHVAGVLRKTDYWKRISEDKDNVAGLFQYNKKLEVACKQTVGDRVAAFFDISPRAQASVTPAAAAAGANPTQR